MSQSPRRPSAKPRSSPAALERLHPDAAGIDCGATEHYVAVPPDRTDTPVRAFRTFTTDLQALADWLQACRVTHVAMEATGVYWMPLFELLESRGIAVILVNARHVKHVPGRKSDVADCEWLRDLHILGLLRGSFRPADAIVALRGYLRHRTVLIESTSALILRMQKALLQMNLQLPVVVSDITGQTGLGIIRAIVAGERDPTRLAAHRHARCHASPAEIVAALTGHYRAEHLFVLQQNLELFDYYQQHLTACDQAIEQHLTRLAAAVPAPATPLPAGRHRKIGSGNEPRFDLRPVLYQLTGVDLSAVHGIGPYTALRLVSELGTDMTRWPTEKHFTSWLTLAPRNKISGGRLLSSRTQPSANRAATMLRLAASTLGRTDTALGAFYRRLAYRVGKAKAITATARKLAVLVYRTLTGRFVYADPGATTYDTHQRERTLTRLRHKAEQLGFALVDRSTGELATSDAVS